MKAYGSKSATPGNMRKSHVSQGSQNSNMIGRIMKKDYSANKLNVQESLVNLGVISQVSEAQKQDSCEDGDLLNLSATGASIFQNGKFPTVGEAETIKPN